MGKIKILALDDDNHAISFVDEIGKYYSDAAEIIKHYFLKNGNAIRSEIRMITLVDEDFNDSLFEDFEVIQWGHQKGDKISYSRWKDSFNRLWAVSKEDFYV